MRVLRAIGEGLGRARLDIRAGVVDHVPQPVELLHPDDPRANSADEQLFAVKQDFNELEILNMYYKSKER